MNAAVTKILLLEDNAVEARIIKEYFKEFAANNFVLEHLATYDDATRRIQQGDISLLLMDLTLPDSFGLDTYIKMSTKFKDLPIIVLTNYKDQDVADRIVEIGAEDYIFKSDISRNSLESAIRNALARSNANNPSMMPMTDATKIIEKNISSYKGSAKLFHDAPLSEVEPDVFNEFVEVYKTFIPMGVKDIKEIKKNIKKSFSSQVDAILMLKMSPFDIKEIHSQALNTLTFIDQTQVEFEKLSSIVFAEVMASLYDSYSLV